MKWLPFALCLFLCVHTSGIYAQHLEMLTSRSGLSIRGLSVVDNNIIWVSGTNGTVGRSIDRGKTWKWMQVKNFEQSDFRDIEAFDAATAVIMSISDPAYILKTHDGGENWKVVFEDTRKGMFLDAMCFWNELSGIVIGDPLDGRFFIARTFDGGDSWQSMPEQNRPEAEEGEALFAASGTNIRPLSLQEVCFVTGGTVSRLFMRDIKMDLPVIRGKNSTGANSIAVYHHRKRKAARQMVVVGGDFSDDKNAFQNCALSADGGVTWQTPKMLPQGYRSCVEYISKKRLLTCGTSGVDISSDGGIHWRLISEESFHVCRKAKKGQLVILAGKDGRIARLIW